ncbi:MAG: capping complex subunit for YIEGIA [Chitinophagales bacterium]
MAEKGSGGVSDGQLVAVVTTNEKKVIGDIPIFLARDTEELERWALILSRSTRAMVHELDPEVLMLIRH